MSLSYYDHATPLEEWWNDEKRVRAVRRAKALAFHNNGEAKFLESMQLWVYIQASRSFFSEFDTYRLLTKQSSSTMHTLAKRITNASDFEEGTLPEMWQCFNKLLETKPDITTLKANLPEGWLQERLVCLNYKCLQNIIYQRQNHRLKYWNFFIDSVLEQVQHPEFLVQPKE
jgi:hypothetical protein